MDIEKKEELFEEYLKGGISQKSLAEKYNVTTWAVRKIIAERRTVVVKPLRREKSKLSPGEVPKILSLRESGKTLTELSEMYGVTPNRMSSFCREHRMDVPRQGNTGAITEEKRESIIKLYTLGLALGAISDYLSTTPETVKRTLLRSGVYNPGRECISYFDRKISCKYQLGFSIEQISEELDLPASVVRDRIDSCDLSSVEGVVINRSKMRAQEVIFKGFCEWAEKVFSEGLLKTERWVCLEELSLYFGVDKETMQRLASQEKFPCMEVEGSPRFRISEVTEILRGSNEG